MQFCRIRFTYTSASHEESNANQKPNKIFIQYCTLHTASFTLFLTLSDSLFLPLALLYLLCTYVERVLLYNMMILIIFKYMDTYIIIIHPPNISARTSVHLYTYKYTPPLALIGYETNTWRRQSVRMSIRNTRRI